MYIIYNHRDEHQPTRHQRSGFFSTAGNVLTHELQQWEFSLRARRQSQQAMSMYVLTHELNSSRRSCSASSSSVSTQG